MAGCTVEEQEARVERVIDARTVVLSGVGTTRLIGVKAPEEGRCGDAAATRFTRSRLQNQRVKYELGKVGKDRWRRTLAYLKRGGRMHNLVLIEEGYAKALTTRPNNKYADRFEAAEREAKRQDKGPQADCAKKRQEDALTRARARARAERAEQAKRLARRLRAVERRAKEEQRQDRGGGDGSGDGGSSDRGASDRGASDNGARDSGAPKKRWRVRRIDPEPIRRFIEPRRTRRGAGR